MNTQTQPPEYNPAFCKTVDWDDIPRKAIFFYNGVPYRKHLPRAAINIITNRREVPLPGEKFKLPHEQPTQ